MENIVKNSSDPAGDPGHPMNFLLSEDLHLNIPTAGEIRRGEVVEHLNKAILIDIGAKSEGIIAGKEFEALDTKTVEEELAIGNEVSVYVVDPEDAEGNVILSYTKAAEEQDWQTVEELAESRETYEGKVVGHNKGGLLANVGHLRGFIPISQLSPDRHFNRDGSTMEQLRAIVGDDILVKVIEVDRSRNRLILSERAATKEVRAARRARLLEELREGEIRDGHVVNLTDFGAFVDIGGIEGLVHISELNWKRVTHPSDVLSLGDEVRVYVLNVDKERQRIGLSTRRLQTDPWTIVDEIYQVGQLTEATITKLVQFGAFARLKDDYELEGLIHISELSDERVSHPREIVRVGETVTIRIIRVDPEKRQLGLSLKQVSSEEYLDADVALAMGEGAPERSVVSDAIEEEE